MKLLTVFLGVVLFLPTLAYGEETCSHINSVRRNHIKVVQSGRETICITEVCVYQSDTKKFIHTVCPVTPEGHCPIMTDGCGTMEPMDAFYQVLNLSERFSGE